MHNIIICQVSLNNIDFLVKTQWQRTVAEEHSPIVFNIHLDRFVTALV